MVERQIERGQVWLEKLLTLLGTPAAVISKERETPDGELAGWLVIDKTQLTPDQIKHLIGEDGKSIDSMQYLANALLNIGIDASEQRALTIELDGYRLKREQELFAWANQVIEQVRRTGEEAEMSPLSSAERRQIHTYLKKSEDLTTESRGQEPNRRLVVRLR